MPSTLLLGRRLLHLLLGLLGLLVVLFFRLDELEERIIQQLLLEVLLEIEQRHVQEIHRLVQAWIDLQLLPELGALDSPGFTRTPRFRFREPRPQPRGQRWPEIDARPLCRRIPGHEPFPTP